MNQNCNSLTAIYLIAIIKVTLSVFLELCLKTRYKDAVYIKNKKWNGLKSKECTANKDVSCSEITFFVMSAGKKLIQMSKYCFLIGQHSNLDRFFAF